MYMRWEYMGIMGDMGYDWIWRDLVWGAWVPGVRKRVHGPQGRPRANYGRAPPHPKKEALTSIGRVNFLTLPLKP